MTKKQSYVPGNPHPVGSREFYLYNNPHAFDASKDFTPAERAAQRRLDTDPRLNRTGGPGMVAISTPGGAGVHWVPKGTDPNAAFAAFTNPPGGRPPGGGGGGGRGRGGGGGGGVDPTKAAGDMMGFLNRYKPKQQTWQNLAHEDYKASAFRDFDAAKYAKMKQGLSDAITADRASGNAQYAQLGQEMAAYRNPYQGSPQTSNPGMSAAMQRMFDANGVDRNINQADTNYGNQADLGFGNLLNVLALASQQEQASRMRSNEGYQRNFNERLDAELRGGNLGVDMAEANARELYEKEKWEYGEQVARMNYEARMQNAQYNNQGQNAANAANVQGDNAWNQGALKTILEMIAAGAQVDPAAWTPA